MTITLSEALTQLAQAGTNWLERQMRGDSEETETSCKVITGFRDVGEAEDRRELWKLIESLRQETAHLQSEIVGLRDLVDAVAADQGNDRKAAEELYDSLRVRLARVERLEFDSKRDDLADLGGLAEAIRTLMRDVIRMETVIVKLEKDQPIGREIPLDVRAVVRDATMDMETRVHALAAQVEALEERLSQVDRQQRGWRAGIDALMGRRPRG